MIRGICKVISFTPTNAYLNKKTQRPMTCYTLTSHVSAYPKKKQLSLSTALVFNTNKHEEMCE